MTIQSRWRSVLRISLVLDDDLQESLRILPLHPTSGSSSRLFSERTSHCARFQTRIRIGKPASNNPWAKMAGSNGMELLKRGRYSNPYSAHSR